MRILVSKLALLGFVIALGGAVGCGSTKKNPSFDGSIDGGSDGSSEAGLDGGSDGATEAGADASADGSIDASADAATDASTGPVCPPVTAPCSAGCGTGLTCVKNLCGQDACQFAGATCDGPQDCATGSTCTAGNGFSVCVPDSGTCNDARDCPEGFACEGSPSACVDRRFACQESDDCPMSYSCSKAICAYVYRPCTSIGTCSPLGADCTDIDVDGDFECALTGGCSANSDCTAPDVCGLNAYGMLPEVTCGAYGPCQTSATCAPNFDCLDIAERGQSECVPTGGTCAKTSDCPTGQVCAVPRRGGAPHCVHGAM